MAISGPQGYNGRSISAEAKRIGKGSSPTLAQVEAPGPVGPQPLHRRLAIATPDPSAFIGRYSLELGTTVVMGVAVTGSYVDGALHREFGDEGCLLTNERRTVLWQRDGLSDVWTEDATLILGANPVVVTSGVGPEGLWVVVGPPGGPVFGVCAADAGDVDVFADRLAGRVRQLGGSVQRVRPSRWRLKRR